jgi:hypothetical protein
VCSPSLVVQTAPLLAVWFSGERRERMGDRNSEQWDFRTSLVHISKMWGKVSRSKVVSSFFIDDIFYVVIVFKVHEIIYLRKRQYITGDIL